MRADATTDEMLFDAIPANADASFGSVENADRNDEGVYAPVVLIPLAGTALRFIGGEPAARIAAS